MNYKQRRLMPQQSHTSITLATKVTLFRILGIPVFILLMIYYKMSLAEGDPNEYQRMLALTLFIVIALTDALDGYLARTRNEITRLGAILDPLADKALLLSAIILLTRPSLPELQPQFPVIITMIVISRDAVLLAGTFIIHWLSGSIEVNPRISGKLATVFQMSAVIWALAAWPGAPFLVLAWLAALLTMLSGVQYVYDGKRYLEKHAAHT